MNGTDDGRAQKRLPRYSGVLQTNSRNPKFRKKIGRITLWDSQSASPRAPVLYGLISTSYGISLVSLWRFEPVKFEPAKEERLSA
jgi:hypothetical protein